MEPKPPTEPVNLEKEPILTLEEFVRKYESFYKHFVDFYKGGEYYKEQPHYKRLIEEHFDLASDLCAGIQKAMKGEDYLGAFDQAKALEPFNHDLYEAYKIMRSYGTSNKELFANLYY